jgi:hypothetical protein
VIAALLIAASLVHGDFDHDGHRDSARFVRIAQGGEIVVDLGRGRTTRFKVPRFNDPYVAVNRERGRVRTACGKAYEVSCTDRSPNSILLRGGELLFGQRESQDFVLLFRAGRFIVVQLSD